MGDFCRVYVIPQPPTEPIPTKLRPVYVVDYVDELVRLAFCTRLQGRPLCTTFTSQPEKRQHYLPIYPNTNLLDHRPPLRVVPQWIDETTYICTGPIITAVHVPGDRTANDNRRVECSRDEAKRLRSYMDDSWKLLVATGAHYPSGLSDFTTSSTTSPSAVLTLVDEDPAIIPEDAVLDVEAVYSRSVRRWRDLVCNVDTGEDGYSSDTDNSIGVPLTTQQELQFGVRTIRSTCYPLVSLLAGIGADINDEIDPAAAFVAEARHHKAVVKIYE